MYIASRTGGNRLLELWSTKPIEGMPRQKSAQFMDRYAKLPEVFTFDDFSMFYGNERSARNAISKLVSNKFIQKVKVNVWKKLIPTMDSLSTYRGR